MMKPHHTINLVLCAVGAIVLFSGAAGMAAHVQDEAPQYDAMNRLILPADYRDWVFLSSGLDMSYSENQPMDGSHMFNNVFVPRAPYETFKKTGHWPDKTVLVLENRGGVTNRSILKHGQIQTSDIMGLEVHVKDDARFKGGWGFFSYNSHEPAKQIPTSASCYSCHQAHGAVDTTFVQFYPTLMPIAAKLKSLSKEYLAENTPAMRK